MPLPKRRPPLDFRTIDVHADGDAVAGFAGYAARFWSVDAYGTALKPGAFRKTLKERDGRISLLWQHDPFTPIGKPSTLKEDRDGLAFRAEVVTETRAGAEAMALLRADVPLGMSFGFETVKSRPLEDADADKVDFSQASEFHASKDGRSSVRVIEEVRLWEISLVTFPANDGATVDDVRAIAPAALSSLLDAITAGALDDERRGLVAQIVAAWGDGAEPPTSSALTPAEARPVDPFDLVAAFAVERARQHLAGVRL